jgi:regulatory protein
MGYLARREHSQEELRQKLVHKGFPERLVNTVIADFGNRGLQSDARFVEVFTRSRLAKGYGAYRIQQELCQRGIEEGEIPAMSPLDWDGLIQRVYAKKFGDTPPESLRERVAIERFLLGRGFSGDQIRRLLRRLREVSNEE